MVNKTLVIEGAVTDNDLSSEWVTGLKELNDFEKKISFDKFLDHIENMNVEQEFRILKRITHTNKHLDKMYTYKDSMYKKNRYEHLIAFKHSMPKAKDDTEDDFYINANYIAHPLFKHAQKQFIVGQGPTASSSSDFWKVMYQHDVCVIIMLCDFKKEQFVLEEKYFPKEHKKLAFDELEVRNLGCAKDSFNVFRKLSIKDSKEGKVKELKHYNIRVWDDMEVLSEDHYKNLLDFIKLISAIAGGSDQNEKQARQPIFIHCKAGIGRSGVFMAIIAIYDYLLTLYLKYGDFFNNPNTEDTEAFGISIFAIVRRMREDRWGLIQKPKQYYFVYEFTKYMLENLELL